MSIGMRELRLKKNEERRINAGHLWIYSNEVARETPLKSFEPGELVRIFASNGKALGTGYVNPNSLICARVVSRDVSRVLDVSLMVERIRRALALREMLYDQPYYRLVFGESDGLPGLVVDRFADVLVVQLNTAGMQARDAEVLEALQTVLQPSGVLWRNDSSIRSFEGLSTFVRVASGEVPDVVELIENGARFEAPLVDGQKTGWFYDQRANRQQMVKWVEGRRVLDVFSYVGGWGIQALLAGAAKAVCVDSSSLALGHARASAELNEVGDRFAILDGDAFTLLKDLKAMGNRFGVVVIDPPAFIKRKKDLKEGQKAYRRINQLAMGLLDPGGILISCSCSHHLQFDDLRGVLNKASMSAKREIQLLERGQQPPDHPIHPAIWETEYLKSVTARVL